MKELLKQSAIGLLLLRSLCAVPAGAQLGALGPETVVASSSENILLTCPRVIGHEDQSFTLVWAEGPALNDLSLAAQRFDGSGASLGEPIDVDRGQLTGRSLFTWDAANRQAALGGDIVVWGSELARSRARRFYGRVLSEGAPAAIAALSYVSRLAPQPGGGYVAVWPAGSHSDACAVATLDVSGHLASPPIRPRGALSFVGCIQLAQALDGSFAMEWYHSSPPIDERLRRFDATGRPLGREIKLEAGIRSNALLLGSAPDGRTAVTWNEDFGSFVGIGVQFFGLDGQPASHTLIVDTVSRLARSSNPEGIAMDRLGRALILWGLQIDEPSGRIERHTLQLWTPSGPASPALDLGASDVFCASAAAAGRAWVVAWKARLPTGDSAIFVRRFFS